MPSLRIRLTDLKTIIVCLLILNALSLLSIYSSLHQEGEFINRQILYKQITWIIISWVFLIFISFVNYRIYFYSGYLLYGINLILLTAVSFFGKTVMGAQRWLHIFGISFQPSELSKIAIIILLAKFFSQSSRKGIVKNFLLPFILVALNALVIAKQPDLGTAFLLIFLFFAMGLFSNVSKKYFVYFIIIGLLLSPFILSQLKDYQKKRLIVFINPNVDPLGSGYTIIQSKIAIGSGKFFGKGFLAGTQNQFNFLPERHTDFIFTVVAEEWGFLGGLFLLFIYWMIIKKILDKTKELKDSFAYFLCLGISLLFFIHVFINVGMTLGILPVVGLPLIFLSYGGSNLLIASVLIGIFFNICRSSR